MVVGITGLPWLVATALQSLHLFTLVAALLFVSYKDFCHPLEKENATHSSILAENSVDRRAWQATVYGVAKSQWLDTTEQLTYPKESYLHCSHGLYV